MKKNITAIAGLIFAAFAVVIIYQSYIQIYQGSYLLNHPRNRRLQLLEEAVLRGRILDRNGQVLAKTVVSAGRKKRIYPLGEAAGNITGYLSGKLGRSGLESSYNEEMLGIDSSLGGVDFWALERKSLEMQKGNDIVLSVDAGLQELAYRLIGPRKGAVVAIEPSTGRVLAMASRPGFNPQDVDTIWDSLRSDPASPLLDRAAQGQYPPGSTMKVVTAAGMLTLKPQTVNRTFDAPGYVEIEGRRIEDRQARGRLSLAQALARSSNYVFSILGIEQGAKSFVDMARAFGLAGETPFDVPTQSGRLPEPERLSKLELAESAIGQGRILVTPLQMCLVAAGIANDGKIMAPSLMDKVLDPDGSELRSFKPRVLSTPVSSTVANTLAEMMTAAVSSGTGHAAAISGVKVAGKTGSAENPHGPAHAWFIGFAPAEEPEVAVAVVIENGGAGGTTAAPIAREIIKTVIGWKR